MFREFNDFLEAAFNLPSDSREGEIGSWLHFSYGARWRQQNEAVIIMRAYWDESGWHDGSVISIAGYIARSEVWDSLEETWRLFVDDLKVSRFHMSDCCNGFGEFSEHNGWNIDRRRKAVKMAVQILRSAAFTPMLGVGSSVVLSDFRKALPVGASDWEKKRYEQRLREWGYRICVSQCLFAALTRLGSRLDGNALDVLLDYQQKVKGQVIEMVEGIRDDLPKGLADRIGTIQHAVEPPRLRPIVLQTADVLAYETYRETRRKIGCDVNADIRISLDLLMEARSHVSRLFDAEEAARCSTQSENPADVYIFKKIYGEDSDWAYGGGA